MRTLIASLLFAAGLACAADPVTEIQKKDHDLQIFLRHNKGALNRAKQDTLKHLINDIFDFQELGKRSMGKNWATLSKAQQDEFIAVFKTTVENTSIKRLENYRSDSARYVASGSGMNTVVKGTVWSKGKSSKVEYKLLPVAGRWRAWDLVLDDLSTMKNYREQFQKIMQEEGYKGLIKRLKSSAN